MHRVCQALQSALGHMEDLTGGLASPGLRTHALKCVNTLSGHHSGIRVIAVHHSRVFTGSYDNTIKVWDLDSGSCEATLEGHAAWIRSLFCSRERLLFSGADDGMIKVWKADTHEHVQDILPPVIEQEEQAAAANRGILAITLDYERSWLIAGSYDAHIYIWEHPSYTFLHLLSGHRSAVRSLVIYQGCLMSGSYDRTIKLWQLDEPTTCVGSLGTRGSVWALAVHGGMLIGAIGDSSIKVWRMDSWEQVATLSGHRGLVLALATHNGRLLSGSDDRCIRVWRLGSWECERILTGHNGGVVGVCMVQGEHSTAPFCTTREPVRSPHLAAISSPIPPPPLPLRLLLRHPSSPLYTDPNTRAHRRRRIDAQIIERAQSLPPPLQAI
jgi:WD40 repeat protein